VERYERIYKEKYDKNNKNFGKKWDLVIDFCAFKPNEIYSVYNGLKNRVKLYIFISTDSIYDATTISLVRNQSKNVYTSIT
jgi:hypothetical protein